MAAFKTCRQPMIARRRNAVVPAPSNAHVQRARIGQILRGSHAGARGRVQRVVSQVPSRVVSETHRSAADACLLHLHGNEYNALSVAKILYKNYCVNLSYIDNPGKRVIKVTVPRKPRVHKAATCRADPNRIFDDALAAQDWGAWKKYNRAPCAGDPVRKSAQDLFKRYRNEELYPAIAKCKLVTAGSGGVKGADLLKGKPVAVFHNNTPLPRKGNPKRTLTIKAYTVGGMEEKATETDAVRLKEVAKEAKQQGVKPAPSNPHIESGQSLDDFVLVTQPKEFVAFVKQRRNVVLQALTAPRDGSLSVLLKSGTYVNVETEKRSKKRAARMEAKAAKGTTLSGLAKSFDDLAMGVEAMKVLGVRKPPC